MNGFINVYKDRGFTSHDVVAVLRGVLGIKKIGHTGTLDPEVAGVLPICLGSATRLSEYIMEQGKEYYGEMQFGYRTDTLDGTGTIIGMKDVVVTDEALMQTTKMFNGIIDQKPPMFSAVKIKGKKLYEEARKGKNIDRPTRAIEIYSFEIIRRTGDVVHFYCHCSKGTYIRALVDDFGIALGTYATMTRLTRSSVGRFAINQSLSLDSIRALHGNGDTSFVLPMDGYLYQLKRIDFPESAEFKLTNGQAITLTGDYENGQNYKVYCGLRFMGIGIVACKEGILMLRMQKMLAR